MANSKRKLLRHHPVGVGREDAPVPGARARFREHVLGGRIITSFSSTAPLAGEMKKFIEDCLDVHVFDGYGLTELLMVTKDGFISRPPVLDYKLVDVPELGYFRTDKPHPRGELLVKSATAFQGYFKRPDVTADAFDAGLILIDYIQRVRAPGEHGQCDS